MEASGHALTGLLLTYPVHQACDILFCKGNIVPVGRDQLPHIEVTAKIARRFNDRYGKVFPEVAGLLTSTPLIPGLDGRKMSKSYGNAISISMTEQETAKLIKKSRTDSERFITFDPDNRPGVSALLTTAGICLDRDPVELAAEIGNRTVIGYDAHQPEALLDEDSYRRCRKILSDLGITPTGLQEIEMKAPRA
jgi:tryptophanyl-tRNA synthetase